MVYTTPNVFFFSGVHLMCPGSFICGRPLIHMIPPWNWHSPEFYHLILGNGRTSLEMQYSIHLANCRNVYNHNEYIVSELLLCYTLGFPAFAYSLETQRMDKALHSHRLTTVFHACPVIAKVQWPSALWECVWVYFLCQSIRLLSIQEDLLPG